MSNAQGPLRLVAALVMLATLAGATVVAQEQARDQPKDQAEEHETSLDFAQVRNVVVTALSDETYQFSVTVRHRDEGWDHYADVWVVYDPDTGDVLGTRELLHPHDAEQPFTRSLSGVRIPGDLRVVAVRAACNVHGFGGREIVVDLDTEEGDGYEVRR